MPQNIAFDEKILMKDFQKPSAVAIFVPARMLNKTSNLKIVVLKCLPAEGAAKIFEEHL